MRKFIITEEILNSLANIVMESTVPAKHTYPVIRALEQLPVYVEPIKEPIEEKKE